MHIIINILIGFLNFISLFFIYFLIYIVKNFDIIKNNKTSVILVSSFFVIIFLLSLIYPHIIKNSDNIFLEQIEIDEISNVEISYVSPYISYYLISSQFNKEDCFLYIIVTLLLMILMYKTRLFYYNPLLYFLGYKFYCIKTINKINILLITREEIKKGTKYVSDLKQINEFTYLSITLKNYEN